MVIDFANKDTIFVVVYIVLFFLIITFIVLLFRSNSRYKRLFSEYKRVKSDNEELEHILVDLKSLNAQLEVRANEMAELKDEHRELSELYHQDKNSLTKVQTIKDGLEEKLREFKAINSTLEQEVEKKADLVLSLKSQLDILDTKYKEHLSNTNEKLEFLTKSEERLKSSFENLANSVLESANSKISKVNQDSIKSILSPLQGQIKEFKDRIEHLNKEEAKEINALSFELKSLKELNLKLSNEANSLTKALSGESKTQGLWGEMVLEKVLEMSGLREGKEYKREVSLEDNKNQKYRPDVVVYLPQKREVIVDSKTSLKAFKEYVNCEDSSLEMLYLKEHIKSVKIHIDRLSEKKYEELKGVNSLDFVFIFIPIENALLVALEEDSNLFEYAFKRRVVLVSPTTLLVSLRAIESSWRYERQSESIAEVIKNAESIYDKVRLFVEDFEKIGKSLKLASDSYESAFKKLSTGKGNVIRQVELLKERANIKPKKEIPKLEK